MSSPTKTRADSLPGTTDGSQRRVDVLGCEIDVLDMEATVRRCVELAASGRGACQVSVNAGKLVACSRDPQMARFVQGCEVVNADGQAVVWASRLLGQPLPERVAGIDLMQALLAEAALQGLGVFVLGAKQEVLDAALEVATRRYPSLRLVGSHHGYFTEAEAESVAARIRDAAPDILFIAMSSPQKELFLDRYRRRLGVGLAMGVGGSIDVMAGKLHRAPAIWQRLGLEWLYRMLQEPGRMWRRYLVSNTRFLLLLAPAVLRRAWGSDPGG